MSKGTTIRNVRVSDELWDAALAHAAEHNFDVSSAIRWFLKAWIDGEVVLTTDGGHHTRNTPVGLRSGGVFLSSLGGHVL